MELQDIVEKAQFEKYYQLKGFKTTAEKIDNLKREMKIVAILCEGEETPEETLAGLEDSALFGIWRAS